MNVQRTVTLPIAPDGSWALAWSGKYDADVLPYQIDCTSWLTDGAFTVASVAVSASAGLAISQLSIRLSGSTSPQLISLVIGGGVGGTTAQVGVTLGLAGGDSKYVSVSLPVLASPTGLVAVAPAGAMTPVGFSTTTLLTVL